MRTFENSTSGGWVYRHRLPVRIMHWVNVVCLFILLMSGLQIFNAHPALYWGRESYAEPPLLQMGAKDTDGGPVKRFGHHEGEFPVTEALARECLSLPIFPGMTEGQIGAVADAVAGFFDRGR